MTQPARSDEPIWWALFSAGGVCFAVLIPGLILTLAIAYPLGLLPENALDYAKIRQWLFSDYWGLAGLVLVGAGLCMPLFHAMHRVHHGMHDLMLSAGGWGKVLCYGSASLLSAMALYFWYLGLSAS